MERTTVLERADKKLRQAEKRRINDQFADIVEDNKGVDSKRFIEKVYSMITENLTSQTAKFNFYNLSVKFVIDAWLQQFELDSIEFNDPKKAIEKELQRIEKQFYGEYYYPSKRDYYKDAFKKSNKIKQTHLLILLEKIFINKPFATKYVDWSLNPNTAYAMTLDVIYYMELKARFEVVTPSVLKLKTDPSVLTPLARHWALFFTYLNPSVLDVKPTIEKFCKEHNVNFDAETIRSQWYKKQYNNVKKRVVSKNLKDIEFVIKHFLENYPKEKTIAENEIKDLK